MSRKQTQATAAKEEARAKEWLASSNALTEQLDADIVLFNAGISRATFKKLTKQCLDRRRRKNVLLILTTKGGDPDAAYWIGRTLQNLYDHFTLFVPGLCKSAGTLVALAADELVISDLGELGPLDVQKSKKDHLFEAESGLTVHSAMNTLQGQVWLAFQEYFMGLEEASSGRISVQTAADIACKLAVGAFSPLYSQIDPSHIGESAREMQIATEYGSRLIATSQATSKESLERLVSSYPTHSFVIDRAEAATLFTSVRAPSEVERSLEGLLGPVAREPQSAGVVLYISHEPPLEAGGTDVAAQAEQQIIGGESPGGSNGNERHSTDQPAPQAAGGGEASDPSLTFHRH